MIRIVHTADFHLCKNFFPDNPEFTKLRRKEQSALFVNIMMYTREQKADILLIAGDLLDACRTDRETEKLLLREFENTPDTEIFISPGRSDPYRPGCFYDTANFPANVHVFKSERMECVELPKLNAAVYGYAFCRRKLMRNPFAVMPAVPAERINLLCGYGSLQGEEGCCPVSVEEILHSGVDYLALGHDHQASELLKAGETYYAVSGAPEGCGFDEPGHKGIRIVAMEKQGKTLFLQSKAIRFSRRHYACAELSAEGLENCAPLAEKLFGEMKRLQTDGDTLLQVTVTGKVFPGFRLQEEIFEKHAERLCYLTFRDLTVMVCKEEGVDEKNFQSVFAMKVAEKTEDAELRSEILKCGLKALEQ